MTAETCLLANQSAEPLAARWFSAASYLLAKGYAIGLYGPGSVDDAAPGGIAAWCTPSSCGPWRHVHPCASTRGADTQSTSGSLCRYLENGQASSTSHRPYPAPCWAPRLDHQGCLRGVLVELLLAAEVGKTVRQQRLGTVRRRLRAVPWNASSRRTADFRCAHSR